MRARHDRSSTLASTASPRDVFHSTHGSCGLGRKFAEFPILEAKVTSDRLTIFLISVPKWSDGTADLMAGN
jgi:hypothetical protein